METRPIQVGILTVSDRASAGAREDQSGPALREQVAGRGWEVAITGLVPDDRATIEAQLRAWVDAGGLDVVLTTGGTGFAPRDVTPEATRAVIDRPAPGLVEAMRSASLEITPYAMLSRSIAGIRASTLIVNLPGSPKAAREHLEVLVPVLPHAVELLRDSPDAEGGHAA